MSERAPCGKGEGGLPLLIFALCAARLCPVSVSSSFELSPLLAGGAILADEMGLGKTAQVGCDVTMGVTHAWSFLARSYLPY